MTEKQYHAIERDLRRLVLWLVVDHARSAEDIEERIDYILRGFRPDDVPEDVEEPPVPEEPQDVLGAWLRGASGERVFYRRAAPTWDVTLVACDIAGRTFRVESSRDIVGPATVSGPVEEAAARLDDHLALLGYPRCGNLPVWIPAPVSPWTRSLPVGFRIATVSRKIGGASRVIVNGAAPDGCFVSFESTLWHDSALARDLRACAGRPVNRALVAIDRVLVAHGLVVLDPEQEDIGEMLPWVDAEEDGEQTALRSNTKGWGIHLTLVRADPPYCSVSGYGTVPVPIDAYGDVTQRSFASLKAAREAVDAALRTAGYLAGYFTAESAT